MTLLLLAAVAVALAWKWSREPAPVPAATGTEDHATASTGLPAPEAAAAPAHTVSGTKTAAPPQSDRSDAWQLQRDIERALVSRDLREREKAFNELLPALIALDASAAARLVERQEPGPGREELLHNVARVWAAQDVDGAVDWAASLKNENERRVAAADVTSHVARSDPAGAIEVADTFGIGRDDGSVEHLVQIWATENLTAALEWIRARPAGPRRDQLLARIAYVQAQSEPENAADLVTGHMTPGPARQEATLSVLRQWALRDPEAAAAWVERLPDGPLRKQAGGELARVVRQNREAAAPN